MTTQTLCTITCVLVIWALLITGCGTKESTPTSSITPTQEPITSATPAPSDSPTPIASATPITPTTPGDEVVTFPDPGLEAAIRQTILKPEGDITRVDLEKLTSLVAQSRDIRDLTGIQYCTSLTYLDLGGNQIGNLSPLSNLTNLTSLYLDYNQIADISPLSNITNLTNLDLETNQINDLSPLSNLTNLTNLDLGGNQISDIAPLVRNKGLAQGDEVRLWSNPLSTVSLDTYVPQLQEREVSVWLKYPKQPPPSLMP